MAPLKLLSLTAVLLVATSAAAQVVPSRFAAACPGPAEVERLTTQDRAYRSYILRQAQRGDANAQFSLGVMYDTGYLVARCRPAADYWYERSAANGSTHGGAWLSAEKVRRRLAAGPEFVIYQAAIEDDDDVDPSVPSSAPASEQAPRKPPRPAPAKILYTDPQLVYQPPRRQQEEKFRSSGPPFAVFDPTRRYMREAVISECITGPRGGTYRIINGRRDYEAC